MAMKTNLAIIAVKPKKPGLLLFSGFAKIVPWRSFCLIRSKRSMYGL
jgi:hypothetical protein